MCPLSRLSCQGMTGSSSLQHLLLKAVTELA